MLDEGPSPEDIDRFGGGDETGYCPACGAEIWDLVDFCPKCRKALPSGPARRPPLEEHFRRKMLLLVVILMVVGLLLWLF